MEDDLLSLVPFKSMLITINDDFKKITKGLAPKEMFQYINVNLQNDLPEVCLDH